MLSIRLPDNLDQEINELEEHIHRFQKGLIPSAELKARRVPFGVYEQRKADTYMVRVRCPGGVITPAQLKGVADLSVKYGHLPLHITTRQEIQLHDVSLSDLVPMMRDLKQFGLSTRGGGGNTVRNVIIQEDAGVDPDEVFDVTPYAMALTERLIDEPDSWTLPRKFKVAFSGSVQDKGLAKVADVGFIATLKNDLRGFIVYVAGGLGAKSDVSKKLFDFIPDTQVYAVVHAVKLLFWKQGNRKNKHAARLRFLWQKLGKDAFISAFQEYYAASKDMPSMSLASVENKAVEVSSLSVSPAKDEKDFALWKKRFVSAQKQTDTVSIMVPIEFGFLDHQFAEKLATFVKPFGENTLRFTKNQNMIIRNIHLKYLPAVYFFLQKNLQNFNRPVVLDNMISCAGASTCQLGLCLSRGAARAVIERLQKSDLPLDDLSEVRIHFSGCPNSCGQHPVADLGFYGKAGRQHGVIFPAYNVVVGARIETCEVAQLAQSAGEISAKDVPELVAESLAAFHHGGASRTFWQGNGKDAVSKLCESHSSVPTFENNPGYYTDWGADHPFSLAGRGAGECSAGFFDLIDVDNARLDEALAMLELDPTQSETAYNIALYACRMLLITRAEEPKTDEEVFRQFQKHFIDTGLVNEAFQKVVIWGIGHQSKELGREPVLLKDLAKAVKQLYESMDTAFQFAMTQKQKIEHSSAVAFKDFRGVACPMNFVKTKMELSKLSTGDRLEILLDDGEPIDNVPGSVRAEGHKVLKQEKVDQHWSVLIEKG